MEELTMPVHQEPGGSLAATAFLDHGSEQVRRFVEETLRDRPGTEVDNVIALYYAVRDRLIYDVYDADLSRPGLRASAILSRGRGFCVHKSIVFAAACRAVGTPSRLVFADVRNHLASGRLRELVGGDLFCFHTLTSVYLGGRWVKATPVFNKTLCRLYGMSPLEFDGTADSLFQPYDARGRRFMEFVRGHGEFDDFPYQLVVDGIRTAHPNLFASRYLTAQGSLAAEAAGAR
jgi:transglutaminase-like putative cysteine protease